MGVYIGYCNQTRLLTYYFFQINIHYIFCLDALQNNTHKKPAPIIAIFIYLNYLIQENLQYMKNKNFKSLFYKSKLQSIIINSYFHIYESLFKEFKDKPITFVEVGIFGGGSFFQKKLYHPKSRIIGIDLNPNSKFYEKYGFLIFLKK